MNKKLVKTPAGENITRYSVRLDSDECSKGTQLARFLQFEMLRTIATDPSITACGLNDFQTLRMYHDGSKWVIDLEAISADS